MEICLSIGIPGVSECLAASADVGLVEVRADLCGFSVDETVEVMERMSGRKILTYRGKYDEEFLVRVLEASNHGSVQYVDLELEAPRSYSDRVRSLIHSLGGQFIVSFHDFKDTPCTDELLEIYRLCISRGADIVKIVTTAEDLESASRVMALYHTGEKEKPLIAFAMGDSGRFTRRLCVAMGAPWTYCGAVVSSGGGLPQSPSVAPLREECLTAPGQFSLSEMKAFFDSANYPYDARHLPVSREGGLPSSKSIAQRAIIAAALAEGTSFLREYEGCGDTESALGVASAMGAVIDRDGDVLKITGKGYLPVEESPGPPRSLRSEPRSIRIPLNVSVGESGLLCRLAVLVAAVSGEGVVRGEGTLSGRNLSDVMKAVGAAGGVVESEEGKVPFTLREALKGGEITVDGSGSSQSVSGLLMALPLVEKDSVLTVLNPVSLPYIDMTLDVLNRFGIRVKTISHDKDRMVFGIGGGQRYVPVDIVLEKDWSSAAYFFVAAHIARNLEPDRRIVLPEMPTGTRQADERVTELLERCGPLNAFEFDAADCPDLFPIAVALACFCRGKSALKGVERLYGKESNRAEAIFTEFSVLGGNISVKEGTMFVTGTELHGGMVSSHNDHRMAMALAVAALFIEGAVWMDNFFCIEKSFPTFARLLRL